MIFQTKESFPKSINYMYIYKTNIKIPINIYCSLINHTFRNYFNQANA